MASEKQIEANRRNAAKSTGPRTAQGRSRSAQNARKDGYTAETIVLSLEDKPVFDRMHQDFTDQYQPITTVEEQFLLEMVWARWRIHRLWSAESAHLERALDNACVRQRPHPGRAASIAIADEVDHLDKFTRLEQKLTRQFNKAKANLFEAQQIRQKQEEAEAEKNEANADGEEVSLLEMFNRNHYTDGFERPKPAPQADPISGQQPPEPPQTQ